MTFTDPDRHILRELARQTAEMADNPIMDLRRRSWVEHNTLRSTKPMMLVFPEGGWCELLTEESLQCVEDHARAMEKDLRMRLYVTLPNLSFRYNHFKSSAFFGYHG